uniref:Uncharacterized protein n=1 Tax=Chrysotila carterae TaxID=13221 RepID=A0A7S4BBI4_CHRCT
MGLGRERSNGWCEAGYTPKCMQSEAASSIELSGPSGISIDEEHGSSSDAPYMSPLLLRDVPPLGGYREVLPLVDAAATLYPSPRQSATITTVDLRKLGWCFSRSIDGFASYVLNPAGSWALPPPRMAADGSMRWRLKDMVKMTARPLAWRLMLVLFICSYLLLTFTWSVSRLVHIVRDDLCLFGTQTDRTIVEIAALPWLIMQFFFFLFRLLDDIAVLYRLRGTRMKFIPMSTRKQAKIEAVMYGSAFVTYLLLQVREHALKRAFRFSQEHSLPSALLKVMRSSYSHACICVPACVTRVQSNST